MAQYLARSSAVLGGIDLTDMIGGTFEHELELAADGDELPALAGAAEGVVGGEDVQAAGQLAAAWRPRGSGSASPRRPPCEGMVPSADRIE